MAEITQNPHVEVSATIKFNEAELRALQALTEYGTETFLKVFYEKLGKAYLQPHEAGLRSLFDSIKSEVPRILKRSDSERIAFNN